jgi:hypothetical protein
MKNLSGRVLSHKLRALQAAERHIIAPVQKHVAADKLQSATGIDFGAVALSIYAVVFLTVMVLFAGTTSFI